MIFLTIFYSLSQYEIYLQSLANAKEPSKASLCKLALQDLDPKNRFLLMDLFRKDIL